MKIKERKPFIALLLSLLTPGLGQLYNGQFAKALIFFFAILFLLFPCAFFELRRSFTGFLVFFPIGLIVFAVYIVNIIDAFRRARKWPRINLKPYNKWFIYIGILIIFNFFISPPMLSAMRAGTKTYKMPSGSMKPTIKLGDHFIVDMMFYKKQKPGYGELIIFKYPKDRSKDFIKRVIAIEGDKIEINNDELYLNDKKLDLKFIDKHRYQEYLGGINYQILMEYNRNEIFGPVIVPNNSIFVLGDNRNNSMDSRHFGIVDINDVMGKVLYIYWAKDKSRIGTVPN